MRLLKAWIERGYGVQVERCDAAPEVYTRAVGIDDVTAYLMGDGWWSREAQFELHCEIYEFIHGLGKWDEGV